MASNIAAHDPIAETTVKNVILLSGVSPYGYALKPANYQCLIDKTNSKYYHNTKPNREVRAIYSLYDQNQNDRQIDEE